MAASASLESKSDDVVLTQQSTFSAFAPARRQASKLPIFKNSPSSTTQLPVPRTVKRREEEAVLVDSQAMDDKDFANQCDVQPACFNIGTDNELFKELHYVKSTRHVKNSDCIFGRLPLLLGFHWDSQLSTYNCDGCFHQLRLSHTTTLGDLIEECCNHGQCTYSKNKLRNRIIRIRRDLYRRQSNKFEPNGLDMAASGGSDLEIQFENLLKSISQVLTNVTFTKTPERYQLEKAILLYCANPRAPGPLGKPQFTEVKYDRGFLVSPQDKSAQLMRDEKERFKSFQSNPKWRHSKLITYMLIKKGFYADSSSVNEVICSFCKRRFPYCPNNAAQDEGQHKARAVGLGSDEIYEIEIRSLNYLFLKHSFMSSSCPRSNALQLGADNIASNVTIIKEMSPQEDALPLPECTKSNDKEVDDATLIAQNEAFIDKQALGDFKPSDHEEEAYRDMKLMGDLCEEEFQEEQSTLPVDLPQTQLDLLLKIYALEPMYRDLIEAGKRFDTLMPLLEVLSVETILTLAKFGVCLPPHDNGSVQPETLSELCAGLKCAWCGEYVNIPLFELCAFTIEELERTMRNRHIVQSNNCLNKLAINRGSPELSVQPLPTNDSASSRVIEPRDIKARLELPLMRFVLASTEEMINGIVASRIDDATYREFFNSLGPEIRRKAVRVAVECSLFWNLKRKDDYSSAQDLRRDVENFLSMMADTNMYDPVEFASFYNAAQESNVGTATHAGHHQDHEISTQGSGNMGHGFSSLPNSVQSIQSSTTTTHGSLNSKQSNIQTLKEESSAGISMCNTAGLLDPDVVQPKLDSGFSEEQNSLVNSIPKSSPKDFQDKQHLKTRVDASTKNLNTTALPSIEDKGYGGSLPVNSTGTNEGNVRNNLNLRNEIIEK